MDQSLSALIDELKAEPYVYIQPHNFPDHDAVASAYALRSFFRAMGITARLTYDGDIQRESLKRFISDLDIDIHPNADYDMTENDKIVIVDGCKYNKNVTDLIGDEVAVIDHHQVTRPDNVPFSDIRSDYGACSTIIGTYFREYQIPLDETTATAIMVGISMDTHLLTRGVHMKDLEVYFECYGIADISYVNSVLRNYIRIPDLQYFKYCIDHIDYYDRAAVCYFENGCGQNLLGVISDFILALEEIDFVVLCARNGDRVNFSVRSEVDCWDASKAIRYVLRDIGFGGGHREMAGGVIKEARSFDLRTMTHDLLSFLAESESLASQ